MQRVGFARPNSKVFLHLDACNWILNERKLLVIPYQHREPVKTVRGSVSPGGRVQTSREMQSTSLRYNLFVNEPKTSTATETRLGLLTRLEIEGVPLAIWRGDPSGK